MSGSFVVLTHPMGWYCPRGMGKSGDGNVQQQQEEEEEEEEEDDDDEGNGRESNWPLSVRVHTPAYHVGHPPPTSHHTNRDRERERERERENEEKRTNRFKPSHE